jgi:hypothetical protein
VQRLAAGRFTSDQLRPATARLLERFFESPIDELLALPEHAPRRTTEGQSQQDPDPALRQESSKQHNEPESLVQTKDSSAQGSDLLAQADQTRHMMDWGSAVHGSRRRAWWTLAVAGVTLADDAPGLTDTDVRTRLTRRTGPG